MDINAGTFIYMFIRLCPFILVCFFTISSIFNNDIKGIVYLIGLLFTVGITTILSKILPIFENGNTPDAVCNIISFGQGELSKVPISEVIIGFTFVYLLTTMITVGNDTEVNLVLSNWPTIAFFSLLIITELYVNSNIFHVFRNWLRPSSDNQPIAYCYEWYNSLLSYGIGSIAGIIWAFIIIATKTPEFQYFNQYKHNEKCEKANKKTFKCKVFKDGVEIDRFTKNDEDVS